MMSLRPGDLADPRVIDLLRTHVASARAQTAPGSAHALDLSGLQTPDIQVWTIWDGDALCGIGALKRFGQDQGEIKSMHTAQAHRRRGVGGQMLRHLIACARSAGMSRLSLETGAQAYFHPARQLYARHGFVDCPPFGHYSLDANSVFMTLALTAA